MNHICRASELSKPKDRIVGGVVAICLHEDGGETRGTLLEYDEETGLGSVRLDNGEAIPVAWGRRPG